MSYQQSDENFLNSLRQFNRQILPPSYLDWVKRICHVQSRLSYLYYKEAYAYRIILPGHESMFDLVMGWEIPDTPVGFGGRKDTTKRVNEQEADVLLLGIRLCKIYGLL